MASLDDINKVIRVLIRGLLAMPDNSVRPANKNAPAGSQADQFATVLVTMVDATGNDDHKQETASSITLTDTSEGMRVLSASIQFFRGDAYTKACRLRTILTSGAASDKLQAVGLGFVKASAAKNLTGVVDTYWEERGLLEVEFHLIAKEIATVNTFGRFPIEVITETSITTSEVFEP